MKVLGRILVGMVLLGFLNLPAEEKINREAGRMNERDGRELAAAKRVGPRLEKELQASGLKLGQAVFLRIFKEERELEIWLRAEKEDGESLGKFRKFRTYRIAGMSGGLGPKLAEGDRQAPEGFYLVTSASMNPQSRYHLSFNIGYPNAYDQAHRRTGSFIMVHGGTQSVGCFAMTDEKVEEIYTLCGAALRTGQPFFRVHCFPFRMTPARMKAAEGHRWTSFWEELLPGYHWFEKHREPPEVTVDGRQYRFSASKELP